MSAEIIKLQDHVSRLRREDARARVTDAAMHLRKACELVERLDAVPDAARAAEHMLAAADILINFDPDGR